MSTIFCLVSRQTMPNVLPVLMYNPEIVVLFATPEEIKSAVYLDRLFKQKGIKVIRKDGLDAYDFQKFKEVIKSELENHPKDTCLNLTGGTKLMALAAYEVFKEKNNKIIYCDTKHKRIIVLSPEYKIQTLETSISIEDYLTSYGYRIIEHKSYNQIKKYFPLFDFVEKNLKFSDFIRFCNRIRQKLNQNIPYFSERDVFGKIFFHKRIESYEYEFGKPVRQRITFNKSDFRSGDWLEAYVYYKLKDLKNIEIMAGVRIVSENETHNELDLVILKDFKLSIISCKSGKFNNQDLYQLETIRNIASGTFGKGIFVIANKTTNKFLKRAEELSINVVKLLKKPEIII